MLRPDKEHYYLDLALDVAKRSTCLRRKYGAIIVKDDRIVSTGYNGAPRNRQNCCDRGVCLREELKVPSGQRYELCRSVHAEANAIIHATYADMIGGTLYLAGCDAMSNAPLPISEPCSMCKRMIINAQIERVVSFDNNKGIISEIMVKDWTTPGNDDSIILPEQFKEIKPALDVYAETSKRDMFDVMKSKDFNQLRKEVNDARALAQQLLTEYSLEEYSANLDGSKDQELRADICKLFDRPSKDLKIQVQHFEEARHLVNAIIKMHFMCYKDNFTDVDFGKFSSSVKEDILSIIAENLACCPIKDMDEVLFHEFAESVSNKTAPKSDTDFHHILKYEMFVHDTEHFGEQKIGLSISVKNGNDHVTLIIDDEFEQRLQPIIRLYHDLIFHVNNKYDKLFKTDRTMFSSIVSLLG